MSADFFEASKSSRTTLKRQCVKPLGEWHDLNAGLLLCAFQIEHELQRENVLSASLLIGADTAPLQPRVHLGHLFGSKSVDRRQASGAQRGKETSEQRRDQRPHQPEQPQGR